MPPPPLERRQRGGNSKRIAKSYPKMPINIQRQERGGLSLALGLPINEVQVHQIREEIVSIGGNELQ